MYRDVSELPESECIAIIDDKTLQVFNDTETSVTTYKLISDKYKAVQIDDITSIPANLVCYTTEQVETLPSAFDFVTPIYHTVAIISVLFILWAGYRLILYPFFRKTI